MAQNLRFTFPDLRLGIFLEDTVSPAVLREFHFYLFRLCTAPCVARSPKAFMCMTSTVPLENAASCPEMCSYRWS